MKRFLLSALAVASAAAIAGAQQPARDSSNTQPATHHSTKTGTKHTGAKHHKGSRAHHKVTTSSSGGEVALVGRSMHATADDFVGADSNACDKLCQHEKMMDERYGKDRQRLHH